MNDGQTYSIGWDARPADVGAVQVVHSALLLVLVRLALVVLGFQRTARMVDRACRAGDASINADLTQVAASKYAVALAAAFVPARIRCLERSLVLYYGLKRNGVPVVLRLGVRAYPFGAHAWLELEDDPVNETPDRLRDFQPILEWGG